MAKACIMAQQQSSQHGASSTTVPASIPSTSISCGVSPAKVVDLRRNSLQQVKDLQFAACINRG